MMLIVSDLNRFYPFRSVTISVICVLLLLGFISPFLPQLARVGDGLSNPMGLGVGDVD